MAPNRAATMETRRDQALFPRLYSFHGSRRILEFGLAGTLGYLSEILEKNEDLIILWPRTAVRAILPQIAL